MLTGLAVRCPEDKYRNFIENYPKRLIQYFNTQVKLKSIQTKFELLNNEFAINCESIINYALSNMTIYYDEKRKTYFIEISTTKKFLGTTLITYIRWITLGNRSVKGCNIIEQVFRWGQYDLPIQLRKEVQKNVN